MATPLEKCTLNAYSAQICGRWLSLTPSKMLDQHMSSAELCITASLHLGVDVLEENVICPFCGMVLDTKGIHAASCTAGGDISFRHDKVRNILFRFCCREHLRPELEKAEVLDDEGVFVDLRRPADVMINGFLASSRGTERVALDVQVINALRANRFDESL